MTMYPRDGFDRIAYERPGYVSVCGDTERLDIWRDIAVSVEDKDDDPLLHSASTFVHKHMMMEAWSETHKRDGNEAWPWLSDEVEHLVFISPMIGHISEVPPARVPDDLIETEADRMAVRAMCRSCIRAARRQAMEG